MPHLAAILGVLTISFSAIFVRLSGVSADTSAFFRAAYALPCLALLTLALDRRRRPWRLRLLAFSSGLLLGLDLVFWHRAIDWIGAGLATVLGNTQVIFVALGAWVLYRERPRRVLLLSLPVVFAGMLLVSGLGRVEAYGADPFLGTFFGLLTGITYAAFLMVFRASTEGRSSVISPLFEATIGTLVAAGLVGLMSGTLEVQWQWPAHLWLLALALGSQVVGWLLIAFALPRLPPVETSFWLLLQPVATFVWAFLLFAEYLSVLQWSGVALVLVGIALPAAAGRAPAVIPERPIPRLRAGSRPTAKS